MEQYFRIGIFSSTHGIRGEIKVYPTTDSPARFSRLKKVILETPKEKLDLEVEKARFFKGMVILKFKGIDNINDIERYKGASLFVSREDAEPLEENSYYVADLLGCRVETEEGRYLGTLREVMPTGANDVFVVKDPEKADSKEYLLPNIRDCIRKIDPEAGRITVRMMPGLEDL
ncbi:MAG: ribosome maturation factor RimM [Lachnospiraceae bacterium]|nr:ribosome maturation factor RimM [Lachnospiraceae bacterium]